jgi:preprotein translocase subunit SecE
MAKAVAIAGSTEDRGALSTWKAQPERFLNFLKDVRAEMRKVVTPTREEVRSTTAVVLIAVFLFAAYFYVVDSIASHLVERLLHWMSGR